MATNLPSCFSIQFLEQLLKFLLNFTLLKYVKSQRSYGFLITKDLIFGFQILDLKDHFSASLIILNIIAFHCCFSYFLFHVLLFCWISEINCPWGGVFARCFSSRGRGFARSLCPRGWGIRPFEKFLGVCPREGMIRLGID